MSAKREWKPGDHVRVQLNAGGGGYFGEIKRVEGDYVYVSNGRSVFGETLVKERIDRIHDADEWRKQNAPIE